jgi:ABC-type lipoprotein export system ATPase subunit
MMIECENLVKIYSLAGIEVVALQGLDLSVEEGDLLGIVGASGSGKSTLLNVLGGLDRPSAGKVTVGGRDLLKMKDKELDAYRRTQVGFIWQQTTRNLVPYLTAQQNVELPMRLTSLPASQRTARARELLETLGLGERMHHLPAQLSGGEQQRVSIAVALANKPIILLADEPTGEVDSATAADIYEALRKVNQVFGMTILIVSHDPNISQHTQRVIAIRDGKTSTETVRTNGSARAPASAGGDAGQQEAQTQASGPARAAEFVELVVLDSAGRLQIPREYLEDLDIGDRVRIEKKDHNLVIHPVAEYRREKEEMVEDLPSPEELYVDEEDQAPEAANRGLHLPNVLGRLRKISVKKPKPGDNE